MKIKFVMPESLKGSLSEEEMQGLEAVGKALAEQFNKEMEGLTKDDVVSGVVLKLEEFGFKKETINKIENTLKEQGTVITGLQESAKGVPGKSWGEQLKSFMLSDTFKEGMKNRQGASFEIKADPTTIMAGNFSGAQPFVLSHEVEPGINVAPKEPNVIFQLLNKGNTNSRDIYWVNRSYINGDAAFIGEGALKPPVDWTYTKETSNAKKIAASTKVSTEMLEDFEYMESEIRDVLNDVVLTKTDTELLNGAGTGDNLAGILTNASAYVGTDLDGTIPGANVIDAIRALVLQMRLLNQRPNMALLNPTDKAAVDLLKNSTNNYISAEAMAIIKSLTIVETTEIAAGKVVVIDTSKFKVRVYKGIKIDFGWVDKDFQNNLVTVICEMRLHSYHNSIDDSAIAYDDIATIVAALDKPAA